MTQDTGIQLLAPVRPGAVATLSRCSYGERLQQVFEVLAAGWSDYRGQPWGGAYAGRLAGIQGLRSLRLALAGQGPAVIFEAGLDGSAGAVVRTQVAPLLDLVFGSCGTPGAAPAGGMPAASTELKFPAAAAPAGSAQDLALALHALGDLYRLAPLFAGPADAAALHAAASFLLPSLRSQLDAGDAVDPALRAHFADAVRWLQAGTAPARPVLAAAAAVAAPATSASNVQVNGKQQVMQVLLDAGGNTSVSGYAQRMNASMGLIYLGLDKTDPQYAIQSEASNRAIGTVTEDEAFTQALAATRNVLQRLSSAASVDLKDVTDHVLAALCTYWFGIPDGKHVLSGGTMLPLPPAYCPGQFAPVSGSIFQPQPNFVVTGLGEADGKLLRAAALRFVTAQRASGPPAASLAKALFAAFPKSPEQDDLLARTIIGVMMGFLPTAQGNLMAVFAAWKDGKMDSLSQALLAHPELDLLQRARDIVRGPMIAAIQGAPVPPAIWRTAVKDFTLGSQPVRQGDRLFINIDSAMREDLQAGVSDVTPVFGGDRDANPHPTHACPGLWMGMGVMLGVATGVLEAVPTLPSLTASASSAVS